MGTFYATGRPTYSRIPGIDSYKGNHLDLFPITTNPQKYSTPVRAPLGGSDHCFVICLFPCQLKTN